MRKKESKLNLKKIIPLVILIPISGLIFAFQSSLLLIKEVDIKLNGVNCISDSQINQQVNLIGENILLINQEQVKKKLQKFICIKDLKIVKNSINKITLDITGRNPIASISTLIINDQNIEQIFINISTSSAEASTSAIWNLPSDQKFLVDDEGVVFGNTDNSNLPSLLFWDGDIKIGKKINQLVVKNSLIILEKINSFGINVYDARIYSQNLLTDTIPKLIFNLDRDINKQLAALQLIIEKAKIGDEQIEMIDLRFEKPIVRYAPKKK